VEMPHSPTELDKQPFPPLILGLLVFNQNR